MLDGATAEWAGRAPPSGVVADLDAIALQQLDQFAALVHLADDVAAADELAPHIELRDGRPGAEFLDALTQRLILKDIDALEEHAEVAQHLHDGRREAALRTEERRAGKECGSTSRARWSPNPY